MSPVAQADGHDLPGLVGELVPSLAAAVDDILVGGEHAVRQPVVAQDLLHGLDRVQLRGAGRQRQQRDVGGDDEIVGFVPAGVIQHQHGVGATGDGRRCG